MRYADREDYKHLLREARDRSAASKVCVSESPRGGVVVNVRTPTTHVRVWTRDIDDAIEAALVALLETT